MWNVSKNDITEIDPITGMYPIRLIGNYQKHGFSRFWLERTSVRYQKNRHYSE